MTSRQMRKGRWGCGLSCWVNRVLRYAEFLQLGFPKSDHVSNTNTIAHVISFGKTELQELCKPQ